MNISKLLICNSINFIRQSNTFNQIVKSFNPLVTQIPFLRSFQTSTSKYDLFEFFDEKDNWGKREVKVGRNWEIQELRIKSNEDLHKLWFVLLKERNMLLTMEHEAEDQCKLFPNPERIDKVEISMKNLEDVVRERNKAFFELETGKTGEREVKIIKNQLGIRQKYKLTEHHISKRSNIKWQEDHQFFPTGGLYKKFIRLYKEKILINKRRQRTREFNHVAGLLKRFPQMDINNLKTEYPNVDLDKIMRNKKSLGNHNNNTA